MATLDELKMLFAEFPRDAISWRAQSLTAAGDKAMALAYIDARDVMDRLDQIVGPDNWQDRYEFHGSRTICYLAIRVDGEWITKADGAGDSDVEAEKGAISDALKRAAVKWGIGRYLYSMPAPWVPCETYERGGRKHWKRWKVDPWTCVKGFRSVTPQLPAHDPDTGEIQSAPAEDAYAEPPRKANGRPEAGWREDGSRTSFWLKQSGTADDLRKQLQDDSLDCNSLPALEKLKEFYRGKARELRFNKAFMSVLVEEFNSIEARIMASMDSEALAEVPLKDALQQSVAPNNRYLDAMRAG